MLSPGPAPSPSPWQKLSGHISYLVQESLREPKDFVPGTRRRRLVDRFGQTSSDSTAPTQWAFPFLCPYLLGFHFGGAHQTLAVHTQSKGAPQGARSWVNPWSCPQRVHPHGNSTQPSITRLPARVFLATAAVLGLCCLVPVAYFDPEGSAWCLGKDLEVLCQLVRDQGWKNTSLTPRDL